MEPVVYIKIYVQPIQNVNACRLHVLVYVYILITYKYNIYTILLVAYQFISLHLF